MELKAEMSEERHHEQMYQIARDTAEGIRFDLVQLINDNSCVIFNLIYCDSI